MREPTSIAEINLTPIPGKKYWNNDREWREEFIYFIMVDRFHDSLNRAPLLKSDRSQGSGNEKQLGKFCGGTLEGITNHLDYIKNLGCTAIWLSPIFENNDVPDPNSDKYHGYAIQNYLRIDPRFGTKQDLIDLVFAAHIRNMRVFLDVVINHSGDNWYYQGNYPYYYYQDRQFPFGGWRREDRPIPTELQNPNYYHRRGEILNWDAYPETQRGDFFSLKGFNNDDDPDGLILQDILIKAHCYAYNTSTNERRKDFVMVDGDIHNKPSHSMKFLYGKQGSVLVQKDADNQSRFIQLELEPMQFVMLQ